MARLATQLIDTGEIYRKILSKVVLQNIAPAAGNTQYFVREPSSAQMHRWSGSRRRTWIRWPRIYWQPTAYYSNLFQEHEKQPFWLRLLASSAAFVSVLL